VCSLEFPDLERLAAEHEDLVVLGVAGEGTDTLYEFIEQTGITFPVVFDENSIRTSTNLPSSISPYPRQIAFDRKGRIIYVAAEHSNADLEAAILDAL